MKKLQHPNLVKLHEVIDDDENEKLYMSKVNSYHFSSFGLLWDGWDTAMGSENTQVPALHKGPWIFYRGGYQEILTRLSLWVTIHALIEYSAPRHQTLEHIDLERRGCQNEWRWCQPAIKRRRGWFFIQNWRYLSIYGARVLRPRCGKLQRESCWCLVSRSNTVLHML